MKHLNLTDRNLKIIPKEFSNLNMLSVFVGFNELNTLYNLPKNVKGYIWYHNNKLFSADFLSLTVLETRLKY